MRECHISTKLRSAVERCEVRRYQIAALAGMDRATLSGLLTGRLPLRRFDDRVLRLAEVFGVPRTEAFDWNSPSSASAERSAPRGKPTEERLDAP